MFLAKVFTIAQTWKKPKCPLTDEWIKKMWYTHTMDCYTTLKKKKILPFTTAWTGCGAIMQSEVSQSEKDQHPMISLKCRI